MSRLTVYAEQTPGAPRLRTEEPEVIAAVLKQVGVRFERWEFPAQLSPEDSSETILAAFRPHLDALMGDCGAGSADVIRFRGVTEAYPAMRQKFIEEHTHTEDEIRFFVHGSGNFVLHLNGEVYDAHCTAGDLISVPAGTKHWFDAGERPFCTVLRVFTDTSGWTPHYTGEKISALFPFRERGFVTQPPVAVVTDIEGTTTRIAFVHDVLFPYARVHLTDFLARHAADNEVAAVLAEVTRLAPGVTPSVTLLEWMDADTKVTPLKTLQGLIWAEGYARGDLRSEVYGDVLPALQRWRAGGVRLYVYSSGSEAAQKQLFGHLPEGDVTVLFSGYFDTNVGAKRDTGSYRTIATAIGLPAGDLLFLSDVGAELDAAAACGWRTCQLVRPQDAATPAAGHLQAVDFNVVAGMFGLNFSDK